MTLTKLKELVNTNLRSSSNNFNDATAEINKQTEFNIEPSKITYQDWGFESAGNHKGREIPFIGMLNLVRQHFRKQALENENETKKAINDAQNELSKREMQISSKENEILQIKDNKISLFKEKIENLKKEIIRIKENPEELLKDKLGKVGLIIGILILFALTIYLFIFYSSASYSAFFKQFTIDTNLGTASSIFDPKAIEVAFQEGITELILILTIPFVFLGLGYLIHKFQEKKNFKNYFKIFGLIVVTFIFDFILAYEITEKIYNIKKEGSFHDMPDYSVSLAFQSVSFWLIIFAGFVVYLIWGFVFDFVMESYDKLDVVKQAIKARETEIKLYEDDILKNQNTIDSITKEIDSLKIESKNFENIINGNTIIINWEGYEKSIFEFVSGWGHWMSANLIAQNHIDSIHIVAKDFVNNEKINTEPQIA
ncbi:hypothetical protein SAMN05660477_02768 [Soonwooa buanensis]|uniref:Uncharacterized protein n=1 Tax=Soonwooa buanensis TaxID=619805 RepID=A0A1T5GDY3_9FLAO|nr:hypothetical protein [Soonwooa buanensis]SKC06626.1 hypothetical protein SAMN05660477_02768 [Soonwooa buanensis]